MRLRYIYTLLTLITVFYFVPVSAQTAKHKAKKAAAKSHAKHTTKKAPAKKAPEANRADFFKSRP